MSKNMTRKGLAVGAAFALIGTAVVATPAHAADELTLAPNAGTSYSMLEGEAYTLLAGLTPNVIAGNIVQLKYQVTTTATLTNMVGAGTSMDTTAGADTTSAVTAGQPTNTTVYKSNNAPTVGYPQTFVMGSPAAVTAGTPLTAVVTAFLDANANDLLDAGEFSSPARTVSWVDAADAGVSVTLTTPVVGDAAVTASLAFANVNQSQLTSGEFAIRVLTGAGATLHAAPFDNQYKVVNALSSGSFSATSSAAFTASIANVTDANSKLIAGSSVKVEAYYLSGAANNSAFNNAGAPVAGALLLGSAAKNTSAQTIDTVAGSLDASVDVTGNTVRTNKAFVARVKVTKSSAVVSGVEITATVSTSVAASLSATKTLTVGSTTYNTANPTIAAVKLTSNASGEATLNLSTVGYAAADTVTVVFTSQNVTSGNVVATLADAAYTVVEVKALGSATTRSLTAGGSLVVDYAVVDQFKQPLTGNHRLKVTRANTNGTPTTAGDVYATLDSAGKASFTLASTAAGVFTYVADLESQNANTGNWAQTNQGTTVEPAATTVTVLAAQTDVITVTAAGNAALKADAAVNAEKVVDTRVSTSTANTYSAAGPDETATVAGTVAADITGSLRAGAAVTISSSGLLFKSSTAGVFVADSITVYADANGAYTVDVFSNVAGSFTVSVASGSAASKTTTVVFNAAKPDSGTSVSFSGTPATALPGSTIQFVGKITDKYGNVVDTKQDLDGNATIGADNTDESAKLTVSYSGPGLVVGTLPTETGADGLVKFAVLVGNNDLSGSAVATVAYDTNGDGDTSDTGEFSTSYTVTIGAPEAVAKIGSFSGRVAVRVENAKGSDVSVKIGKQWYKFVAKNNNYLQSWKSRKGTSVAVSVYVDGELQNVQTITVK